MYQCFFCLYIIFKKLENDEFESDRERHFMAESHLYTKIVYFSTIVFTPFLRINES